MHALVGNADTHGREIVVGGGSTMLNAAAMYVSFVPCTMSLCYWR